MVIDPDIRSQISPEIERGEKVLWVGKPTPFRVLMQYPEEILSAVVATAMLGLFGLVFVPLTSYTLHFGSDLFSFFVLIFLAAMIFSVGRPLYEYAIAGRTFYAITDQRALIVKPGWNGHSVNSYYQIEHIERRTLANERGDLIFAHSRITGADATAIATGYAKSASSASISRVRSSGCWWKTSPGCTPNLTARTG